MRKNQKEWLEAIQLIMKNKGIQKAPRLVKADWLEERGMLNAARHLRYLTQLFPDREFEKINTGEGEI